MVHANGLAETAIAEMELPEVAGQPLVKADYNRSVAPLPGGYRMVWDRSGETPLHGEMELHMGMLGHAAFVRSGRSVFAHVHPSGSVPMAALALAQPENAHAGPMMISAEVSFPDGFPKPGGYRIYVQVKRDGGILTGLFDARVEN